MYDQAIIMFSSENPNTHQQAREKNKEGKITKSMQIFQNYF
jgi:hypothetical protein